MDDGMPFLCPIPKCGKRFTNEDHLNVHSKTHEMSLALNTEKTSSSFVDQTPTPTKILKNFEEIGLFQELSKNPFDDAYKKALDSEVVPIPGPQSNELNTPTLIMTDTTRHVSTSNTGSTSLFPLAVDRFKSSTENKLKPSPLAKDSSSSSGKKIDIHEKGLNLSGKTTLSTSNVTMVTRGKLRDLTSQVADSTSTDIPFDFPNDATSLQEEDDSAFLGATQSITSPHSTTTIISTTSNLGGNQPSLSPTVEKSTSKEGSNSRGRKAATTTSTVAVASAASPKQVKTEMFVEEISQQQQQCTMQVLLQLPNGQTVPISIPATINNTLIVDDKEQEQQQPQHQQQDIKPLVQQQQQQQQILPAPPNLAAAPSKTRGSAGSTPNTTTMALKQRLKAQLQSQLSPTAKSASTPLVDQTIVANTTPSSAFVPASVTTATGATGSNTSNAAAQQQMTQMFITQTSSSPIMMMLDSPGSEVNMSDSSEYSFDSKRQKMSPESEDPEERRRKFLERNRAAAARCRQKRKHWIGNLERKADDLQNTNLRLQNDVKLLRGEVAHLKTLLLAHKDCPVTQQQRSSGQLQQVLLTENPTAFSSQELAQVVPTGGDSMTSDALPISQSTIMTFLSDGTGVARRLAGLSENGKDDDQ